jgi:hypothetical protein
MFRLIGKMSLLETKRLHFLQFMVPKAADAKRFHVYFAVHGALFRGTIGNAGDPYRKIRW